MSEVIADSFIPCVTNAFFALPSLLRICHIPLNLSHRMGLLTKRGHS